MINKSVKIFSKSKKLVYYLFSNQLRILSLSPDLPTELGIIQSSNAQDLSKIDLLGSSNIQQFVKKNILTDFRPILKSMIPAFIKFVPAFLFRDEQNLQCVFKGLDNFYLNEEALLIQEKCSQREIRAFLCCTRSYSENQIRDKINLGYEIDSTRTAYWAVKASENARKSLISGNKYTCVPKSLKNRFEQRVMLPNITDVGAFASSGSWQMSATNDSYDFIKSNPLPVLNRKTEEIKGLYKIIVKKKADYEEEVLTFEH